MAHSFIGGVGSLSYLYGKFDTAAASKDQIKVTLYIRHYSQNQAQHSRVERAFILLLILTCPPALSRPSFRAKD